MAWTQRTATAALVAVALTGCSASSDRGESIPDSCDGGGGVATPKTAMEILLVAASQSDAALACTVTTGTPEGKDLGRELEKLRIAAREQGITAENVRMVKIGEVELETGSYTLSGGPVNDLEPLTFQIIQLKDTGYRVFFPVPEKFDL
ncbi:hypothetical protein ACFY5D_13875 [Paeniglutamicibacter sp. NPDC012692]|uniref:hypothetical protein n=1 Tax=Paeniglutamicibacter sp. NPDC012692 TaxID=3364388 RepID=UPI00367697FD